MTGTVSSLWRHPIKSHGREASETVQLITGQTMPWDRTWAVAHEVSKADNDAWSPCAAFSRVSKAPGLMAITAELDEATEQLTLTHPNLAPLTFHPKTEAAKLFHWTKPLMPADRAASARLVRVPGRGMTDSDFPSVTLCNMESHRAVEEKLGQTLSFHRWRGNIWFDGILPWAEFDWIGQDIRIGTAILRPRERTDRCIATTSNPDTGQRDADTLGALDRFGHQDFGVRAEVIDGGEIRIGDKVTPL
jgi:hypothetical protein